MTREEAIEKLELMRQKVDEETYRALILAIKALSQVTEVRKLILQAERAGVHLDYGAYLFMNALEKVVGEKQIGEFEQESCDDAISREDAEQMFRNIRCHLKPQDYKSAEEFNTRDLMLLNAEQMIHALPSVTQKSGHWIHFAQSDDCSLCGWSTGKYISPSKYCPNCGAKMESEDKE